MTILQGLVGYFNRVAATGAVAPLGYSPERISFTVVLSPAGEIVDITPEGDWTGKKPRPAIMLVPQPGKRTSGIASNFLWDKTAYVFGRSATSKRPADEHAAFRALHEEALADTTDAALQALLDFLRGWDPARYDQLPHASEMLDQNVVFRLDGDLEYLHERSAAKAIWAQRRASPDSEMATCLVTGEPGPVARLHPNIKGVPGAQSSGASLVSFNLDAFTSYGKEQGANAPVSERAAHAYGTALNALLSRMSGRDERGRPRYTNRVQIGDATTVFWAEADQEPAEAAEQLLLTMLDPPTDEDERARLAATLQQIAEGRPLRDLNIGLAETTRFHILGVSPNASRLSVRFYFTTELGRLYENAQSHWSDLHIVPSESQTPPALWRLLRETAAQGEAENVSPALAGEFARAVFTGRRYPRALLAQTLMRIRADGLLNDRRAALLKAYLARNHRLGFDPEDVPVALDPEENNVGYRLGRLFALLENVQRAALGKRINATIRDKYFGTASANPSRIFPMLLRGAQDHLAAVRKRDGSGLSYWFETRIAEVMNGLDPRDPFPRVLRLEDQGRFAVGYYHQRFAAKAEGKDADDLPETVETEA